MVAAPVTAAVPPVTERTRHRSVAWWGMFMLIATEATVFASLLGSYFYVRAGAAEWPPAGVEAPELSRISIFTIVLLASSAPLVLAERAIARDRIKAVRRLLAASFVMGLVFLGNQVFDYQELTYGARDHAYGSLFYVITGLHGLHVVIGLLMNAVVQAKTAAGRVTAARHETLRVFALYWHFVDVVWIFVFTSLFVSPHVL